MKQKSLDNSVKDNEKLMTREEIIEYLKKRRIEIYGEDDDELYPWGSYSGSFAKPSDFIRIAWDSPY